MATRGNYDPIRPMDLQDATLSRLNLKFQQLSEAVGLTGTTSSLAPQPYTPGVSGAGLTLTNVQAKRAQYTKANKVVNFSMDMTFSVAGSGSQVLVSLPVTPDSFDAGTTFACSVLQGGNMLSGVAVLINGQIQAGVFDGRSLSSGNCELVIAGQYTSAA